MHRLWAQKQTKKEFFKSLSKKFRQKAKEEFNKYFELFTVDLPKANTNKKEILK